MVFLQEVRMVNFSFNKCCQLWGDNDIDYLYSEPSKGASSRFGTKKNYVLTT